MLQNSPLLFGFVDSRVCSSVDAGCYSYCPDVCFRSYRYEISGDVSTAGYLLKVCRSTSGSECVFFPGSQRGPRDRRSYVPHLPVGSLYHAIFVDENGDPIFPDILYEQAELNLCDNEDYGVTLVETISPTSTQGPTVSPTEFSCDGRSFEHDGYFVPLSCNNEITTCEPWTSKFGGNEIFQNLVVIECGTCLFLDSDTPNFQLLGGIDIRGRLFIPDGQRIRIDARFIVVQGELEMASHKPVDGDPDIVITMVGDEECNTFSPVGENSAVCSGPCLVGEKGILIAGGKANCKCTLSFDVASHTNLNVSFRSQRAAIVGLTYMVKNSRRLRRLH